MNAWKCFVCDKTILEHQKPENKGLPESLYWNPLKTKVYCSPVCSLADYINENINTEKEIK